MSWVARENEWFFGVVFHSALIGFAPLAVGGWMDVVGIEWRLDSGDWQPTVWWAIRGLNCKNINKIGWINLSIVVLQFSGFIAQVFFFSKHSGFQINSQLN